MNDEELSLIIKDNVDLTPRGIIKRLDLKRPIYQATAAYGHFGRDEFSWEKLDLIPMLKAQAEKAMVAA